ncbi:hypothetical protein [Proteus phage vB_PmiP_RS10pmA]|nr:hypothetical protein [Proteus phage vB_PmiP_RS10pmA]
MIVYLPELNRYANVVDSVTSFYMNDDKEYLRKTHSCKNYKWDIALTLDCSMCWDNIHKEILQNEVKPSNATFEEFYEWYQKFNGLTTESHGNETWVMRGPERLAIVYHAGDSEERAYIDNIIKNAL